MRKPQDNRKSPLFGLRYLFYDFVKLTAAPLGLLWLRPKVIYENKNARRRVRGGALLIANHTGFIDPIYLQFGVWYRRHHFICLKELFAQPFTRWLFGHFLCIPIDRENFRLESFREITGRLRAGELVSMFPEGRVENGGLAAFKSGMALMAAHAGVPIVPVCIRPRRRFTSRLVMAVGEPVETARYGGKPSLADIDDITAALQDKEARLQAKLR